jgi:hypothetical protein
VPLLYLPAAHKVQLVEPVAVWYRPVPQAMQAEDDADDAYRPALHEVQVLAPAAEYLPTAQASVHADVSPVAELNLPAAHAVHEDWPVEAW